MISLTDVSVKISKGKEHVTLLENVSLNLPTDRRLVILGHRLAGKTTLINLLAGLALPTSGAVHRYSRVSYPVGYSGGFVQDLSLRRNLEHAAELYEADPAEVVEFIKAVASVDSVLDEKWANINPHHRLRAAYSLSYALPFDAYLADNFFAMGDQAFRETCLGMLEARLQDGGLIMTTREPRIALRYGNCWGLLVSRTIRLYADGREAIDAFSSLEEVSLQQGASVGAAA
jgi:capsular polysaccharide transport system ATP-binding protein